MDAPAPTPEKEEFLLDDAAFEAMADEALGPEPEVPSERISKYSPEEMHRRTVRASLDAARLCSVPSVADALSARRKRKFIVGLAETGIVSHACARAGWSRSVAMTLRKNDEAFREAWDEAIEVAADAAEAEALRRGVHGTQKDVYFKGEVCGQETIYSDRLLELTLKARRPDRFRDNHKHEVESKGGVLVIPAAPGLDAWERGATDGQAGFREAPQD